MSMAHRDEQPPESAALTTAIDLLNRGLWPIPIAPPDSWGNSPGKRPHPALGNGWGHIVHTEESLRAFWAKNPGSSVGIKLGKAGGVIDLEVDNPETGEGTLETLLGGEVPETMGWASHRGRHLIFKWDDRLGMVGQAVFEGDFRFPGMGLRFGTDDPEIDDQVQSVCPPSRTTWKNADGSVGIGPAREWNGVTEIANLPAIFFRRLSKILTTSIARAAPPAPAIVPFTPRDGRWGAEERAVAYLARVDPAIDGQGGSRPTFKAACKVGPGFGLSEDQAVRVLLTHYSPRCVPPWSEKEIRHKVADAFKKEPRRGWLLNDDRRDSNHLESLTQVTQVTKVGHRQESDGTFVTSVTSVNASKRNEPAEWDHPKLYKSETPAPFPVDALPEPLIRLCELGAASMTCPIDYFAVAALALAGGVIGSTINLQVKASWKEGPNLYVPIVGPAGSKKSPAVMAMSRALGDIDYRLKKDHELALSLHEQAVIEAKQNDGMVPAAPTGKQLTLDDTTREAVAQVLSENDRGIVVIKDEISAWVASLNAYKGGKGDDKQFWMSCNTGAPIKVNRKGMKIPLYIPRPCVAIVGGLTPAMLPAMRDVKVDDGWLDRLLFSYPEPTGGGLWTEDQIEDECLEEWASAIRAIFHRTMDEVDGRSRPRLVKFTPDGKAEWISFFNAHYLEQKTEYFPQSLSGPWSKMTGYTARLALILSQLHQAFDPTVSHESPAFVTRDDVGHARDLITYFKSHFMRVKAELTGRVTLAPDCAEAILRFLRRQILAGVQTFTRRDITLRFHRYGKDEHAEALAWLAARHVVREMPGEPRRPGEMGRPRSANYEINPLLEPFTEVTEVTNVREMGQDG